MLRILLMIMIALGGLSSVAWAKLPEALRTAVTAEYRPAVDHPGLHSAQEPLEPGQLRGFVTLVQGGIPAAKAEWFVTNQDYDYRPVVVDLATNTLKSRRGKIYTFLDTAQVLLIADTLYSGNTVYLKLLSAEPFQPLVRTERHPSRVGVMLGFKVPRSMTSDDGTAALQALQAWVRPFPDRAGAEAFAVTLRSTHGRP